ncbi:unnamed protein product [Miscanthus lutarioriparius]|uniref:Piwi domain-containing protein n=1 Tax=Miscanthus lutarioriparius TaxID=422564 RepID=A0A811RVB7_9POAL|nr:unnamed protein product [Miscanthus lutarioriparius]
MAAKGNTVNWKEHLGKSKYSSGCSLQLSAAAATPIVATVPSKKETAALAAAGCTEHPTTMIARQSTTRRRMEVLRAANDGSAIDDITHILNKLPIGVGSAGSCNEEAPGERRSDEQTAEDSGFKCSDSRDEKMTDVGSQCSDEKMREDGGSDLFGSEDIGDADSDIIYLEGFPSLDEMEDDICDQMEDAMCEPDYSDEDTEEDEGSEQHHGFDENTGEDDACEQPQWMEVDDGSAAFKEIDEAFLCPEDRECILKLGLGTHAQYKKPSIVSWYDFPELPHNRSYYRFRNIMPIEVVHASNENSAEYNTHEEKSGGSDISTLSGLLDDAVEVQFERGIVRHWACIDFSSLSYRKSLKLIGAVVDMCVTIGMKFFPFPQMLARVKPATLDDIGKTLLDMSKKIFDFITELKEEESAVFLLVILPDDRQYDERIKELCDAILNVTYELCYPYYYKIIKWPLKKTACQIRSKVVKRDVRRRRLALPLVSEAPMIIFGADLLHCMPGEGSESIATVAASLDWPKFRKYFVMESYQPYGEGIIKDLHNSNGGIMIDFFNSFYKRIKQNPQKIIFFRNGLERGQFGPICQQEIDDIKRACAFFNDRYQPQLTYVVVLPTPIEMIGMTDKSKDILPGTEADPTKFKFWCCHRGQKNFSASLVCYHVVHDDNNFPAHELQSLTSKLCTFRHLTNMCCQIQTSSLGQPRNMSCIFL